MTYLKSFIIGSSYPIFASFYYAVYNNQPKKTYLYYDYTMVAPLWFGLWNIISLMLSKQFGLNLRMRLALVSILSAFSVMIIATYLKSYDYTSTEWLKYYTHIFIKYMIVWNLIIYSIETYI